ncbi:hypothetical protein RBU60_04220 [Mesonia sp. MT50]|uniref:Peptidase M50 domain-containing protein n=1 Tax=Mesonia profundi TaxID=3070998 RepID=A0ABU1A1B4_9FLAO|nr:hypothetical protein [Mesonia profundi]MDQ7916768.1 hypothetical protein [Mesonia profundi]
MITFNFYINLFARFIIVFILFTVIGTLSHEFGHIAVAKYFGYETELSYGSMIYYPNGYEEDIDVKKFNQLNEEHFGQNYEDLDLSIQEEFDKVIANIETKFNWNEKHSLYIFIGGPAQTFLTSFLGLIIIFYRRSYLKKKLKCLDWLGVMLALFSLRQVFNISTGIIKKITGNEILGDEIYISRFLDLNDWLISIITAVIGFAIVIYVIFKVIPLKLRFTFILSGFLGGILGYLIWFKYLGKLLF